MTASSRPARVPGAPRGPSNLELYNSWIKTLTAAEMIDEKQQIAAADGKVNRRNARAVELREKE